MKYYAFIALMVMAAILVSCVEEESQNQNPANPTNSVMAVRLEDSTNAVAVSEIVLEGGVIDYGHGVYYFPFVRAEFANKLARFLSGHPSLEVAAMSGDIVRINGRTIIHVSADTQQYEASAAVGYFVVCRSRR